MNTSPFWLFENNNKKKSNPNPTKVMAVFPEISMGFRSGPNFPWKTYVLLHNEPRIHLNIKANKQTISVVENSHSHHSAEQGSQACNTHILCFLIAIWIHDSVTFPVQYHKTNLLQWLQLHTLKNNIRGSAVIFLTISYTSLSGGWGGRVLVNFWKKLSTFTFLLIFYFHLFGALLLETRASRLCADAKTVPVWRSQL